MNADGADDFIFATNTTKVHGYYSYAINIMSDVARSSGPSLESVHVYSSGYGPDGGSQLIHTYGSSDCTHVAHFLVRNETNGTYELVTASKIDNRYPPRPGTVEFTFHRLRTLSTTALALIIYDDYRKVTSRQKYCDVIEAADREILGKEGSN